MEILKIVTIAVVCAVICVIVKQIKPEFVPILQISSLIVIFTLCVSGVKNLFASVSELAGVSGVMQDEYIVLLVKVLGVALITKFAIEICNDSGNSVLGEAVSLAGKAVILMMCFPLLSTVARLAAGMLK